jgi:hypothetical protein
MARKRKAKVRVESRIVDQTTEVIAWDSVTRGPVHRGIGCYGYRNMSERWVAIMRMLWRHRAKRMWKTVLKEKVPCFTQFKLV